MTQISYGLKILRKHRSRLRKRDTWSESISYNAHVTRNSERRVVIDCGDVVVSLHVDAVIPLVAEMIKQHDRIHQDDQDERTTAKLNRSELRALIDQAIGERS